MKSLAKRDTKRRRSTSRRCLPRIADERDVIRARPLYLEAVQRQLDRSPAFKPKTFDELLNHGVLLHNPGEFAEALKVSVTRPRSSPERARPVLPRRQLGAGGDVSGALKSLRAAIVASPASRAQARSGLGLRLRRDNEEFLEIPRRRPRLAGC
jgi:hypothetical protein